MKRVVRSIAAQQLCRLAVARLMKKTEFKTMQARLVMLGKREAVQKQNDISDRIDMAI